MDRVLGFVAKHALVSGGRVLRSGSLRKSKIVNDYDMVKL